MLYIFYCAKKIIIIADYNKEKELIKVNNEKARY